MESTQLSKRIWWAGLDGPKKPPQGGPILKPPLNWGPKRKTHF